MKAIFSLLVIWGTLVMASCSVHFDAEGNPVLGFDPTPDQVAGFAEGLLGDK